MYVPLYLKKFMMVGLNSQCENDRDNFSQNSRVFGMSSSHKGIENI